MHRQFTIKRLRAMYDHPGMWASTMESFGLQLALLVEVYEMEVPDMYKTPQREVLGRLFGPGNVVQNDLLDDTWAQTRVLITRQILRLGPEHDVRG